MQKLYCYVDETGQDAGSKFFWVVVVVSDEEQEALRSALEEVERQAGTRNKKWHNVRPKHRAEYLMRVLDQHIGAGDVFVGCYKKPLPYATPILETVERAIKRRAVDPFQLTVIIDGIDQQSARKYTNALRLRGLRLPQIKGRRDESEPLLRLADMWAGASRAAHEGVSDISTLVHKAKDSGYLIEL